MVLVSPLHRLRVILLLTLIAAGEMGCAEEPPQEEPSQAADDLVPRACTDSAFAKSPMRRMTRDEFHHTIEDLFGSDLGPVRTDLPSDEVTAGFANNALVALQLSHVQDYQTVASRIAEAAIERSERLFSCDANVSEMDCARDVIANLGKRALRRPLDSEEFEDFWGIYTSKQGSSGHLQGMRLVVEALLQYPDFLYRPIRGEATSVEGVRKLTGIEIATRLSFFLWSSIPDAELMDAALQGELAFTAGIRKQTQRMLNDAKFDRSLDQFSLQWLGMRPEVPSKNADEYPQFSPQMWDSARRSVARFFSQAVRDEDRLADLLTASRAFVDQTLAPVYGLAVNSGDLAPVTTDPKQRRGLLTQAGVMQALGTSEVSRPIKRGIFVRNRLLCQDPPPPPPNGIPPIAPSVEPKTIREQLEAHRKDPACASCHSFFDPIGMAFENFDGIGAHRNNEGQAAINASGVLTETDVDGAFDNGLELMDRLKTSTMVSQCFATQLFRFAVARLDEETDACTLAALEADFRQNEYTLLSLFEAITTSDAFRFTGTP